MNNLPNTERKCRNVDSFFSFFLLFVCLLFTAPYVRAQEETRSITLNVQNETVENVQPTGRADWFEILL